jgi:hypothetical protein
MGEGGGSLAIVHDKATKGRRRKCDPCCLQLSAYVNSSDLLMLSFECLLGFSRVQYMTDAEPMA